MFDLHWHYSVETPELGILTAVHCRHVVEESSFEVVHIFDAGGNLDYYSADSFLYDDLEKKIDPLKQLW